MAANTGFSTVVWILMALAAGLTGCGGGGSGHPGTPAGGDLSQSAGQLLTGGFQPTISIGSDGDFFLNSATGQLFGPKSNGVWPTSSLSLVGATGPAGPAGATGPTGSQGATGPAGTPGPAGATGATGPAGATGAAGAPGANGTNGTNGNTILNGTINPAAAVGVNGDFYLNTATNTLFGPKAAGAWPAGVPLIAGGGGGIEVFACSQAVTNTVTVTSSATRWVFCNFNGQSPGTAGTVVNLTLPPASSYPAGSVVTFSATSGTGAAIANFTFTSAGSTLNATNANNQSVAVAFTPSPGVSAQNSSFRVLSDGVSRWYRIL